MAFMAVTDAGFRAVCIPLGFRRRDVKDETEIDCACDGSEGLVEVSVTDPPSQTHHAHLPRTSARDLWSQDSSQSLHNLASNGPYGRRGQGTDPVLWSPSLQVRIVRGDRALRRRTDRLSSNHSIVTGCQST